MSSEEEINTSSDEAVSQFLALTGSSDASQAKVYLEMSANDLQTALNLFLEHQSGGVGGGAGGGGGGGLGFGSSGADSNNYGFDTSASAATIGGGGMSYGGGDDVRAPDQTRRMRLMDFEGADGALMSGVGGGNDLGGLLNHPILGPHAAAMMNMNNDNGLLPPHLSAFADPSSSANTSSLRRRGSARRGTGDDLDNLGMGMENVRDIINAATGNNEEDDDDDEVQITGSTRGGFFQNDHLQQHAQRLNDLFAAPVHLIHSAGGFQGARNVAKDTRRWLLVNLQCDADFACHALNRDVWRDELVENLVREGFVFWQSVRNKDQWYTISILLF